MDSQWESQQEKEESKTKNAPQDNNEPQTGTDKDQQVIYMLMSMKQLMDSQWASQKKKRSPRKQVLEI